MAQEIIGLKVEVDGSSATKSVGSIKQQLKDANLELINAQKNFGDYSKEAVNAAKKVAQLKDSVQEASETAALFDPGKKFQAFAGALSAVAGGFTAVQGALGLVGVESENVEKSLLKVQSALALSQGLSTVADSIKDFQRLGVIIQQVGVFQKAYNLATVAAAAIQRAFGVAVTTTSVAFKALRAAIITTGVGALVVAVGLLVNKIIEWTDSTKKAEEAQKALQKSIDNQNLLIDVQIAKLEALGGKDEEIYQKRVERIQNELRATTEKLKKGEQLNDEELKQRIQLSSQLEVLSIQEQNRINKNQEEEAKKRKEANKKAAEDNKARNQERLDADKELADKRKQQANEIFLSEIEDEKMREEIRIATQFEIDKREIEQSKASKAEKDLALLTLQAKYQNDLKLLNDAEKEKQVLESQDELTRLIDGLSAEEQVNLDYLERDKKIKEEYRQADLDATKDLQEKKYQAVNAGLDLIQSLSGKNEVLGNIFFTVQKAIEIGRIITSTSAAIAKVSADTASIPALIPPGVPNPAFPVAVGIGAKKIAGLKIGAAASIAGIVASSIAKFKGGGGAAGIPSGTQGQQGGATATPPPIPPPAPLVNTRTQLDSTTIQQLGSATNRAYVVESDVTNSQERIRRINRAARLA